MVWHCVIGWVLPFVSKGHSDFFMVKPSKNAWIWSWKHQNSLKCQQCFAQQYGVTSPETWIFKTLSVLSTKMDKSWPGCINGWLSLWRGIDSDILNCRLKVCEQTQLILKCVHCRWLTCQGGPPSPHTLTLLCLFYQRMRDAKRELLFWIFCLEVLRGVCSHDISKRCKTFRSAVNTRCSVMYRAPITPHKDDYHRQINPQFQPPADRAPRMQERAPHVQERATHVQERDQYFGNFNPQPQLGRYAYWQYSVLCKENFLYNHLINDWEVILSAGIVVCVFFCWHIDF
jgi:hypothetical protein